jgi:amino acid transporter
VDAVQLLEESEMDATTPEPAYRTPIADDGTPTVTAADTELQSGAIGLRGALMQSITTVGPAVGLLFSVQYIASLAGVAMPFAFFVVLLIMLTVAVSVAQLARHLPSAGGFFTYISHTVHPRAGFVTAWLFFLYMPLAVCVPAVFMSGLVHTELQSNYSINIPWWVVFLITVGGVMMVSYRGIKISARVLLSLGLAEIAIIVALSVWGLVSPGRGGINLSSFNPGSAGNFHGLYLGVTFALLSLTGWEAAAPVAEETENPRRNIPRAILYSVLIMGVFFVFCAWGLLVGWGTDNVSTFASSSQLPAFVLGKHFWGEAWILVLLAIVNSTFALCLAASTVSTRMFYAMARAGALPASLAKLHPKHKTPVNAVGFLLVLSVCVGLYLGFQTGTQNEYFMMGLVFVLSTSWAYVMACLGTFRMFRRERPAEFSPVLHVGFPLVGTLALVWVVYKSVVPLPAAPVRYAPFIFLGWLAIGIVLLVVMRLRGKEGWLLEAGKAAHEHVETPAELAHRPII